MLSIISIKINSAPGIKDFHFPDGIEDLDELMYRSLEVMKPILPKEWNNLLIDRDEKNSKIKYYLDNEPKDFSNNKYTNGYLNLLMNEILERSKGELRSIQLFFTNLNDRNNLSYDVRVK